MLQNSKLRFLFFSLLVITLLIVVAKYIPLSDSIYHIVLWIQSLGILSPIVFICIYNVATLLFIPGSLLTLNGGFIFGVFWGSIYVFIAAISGATFAFLLGRYFSRNWVLKKLEKYPKFGLIDQAIGKEGWKIVLLTRLSPIFPFNLLNYAFGVTQVSLLDYILGSLGMIPGTVMYVYIGSLAGNLLMLNKLDKPIIPQAHIWQLVMQGIGLIATITITMYINKIAQKALSETLPIEDSSQDSDF